MKGRLWEVEDWKRRGRKVLAFALSVWIASSAGASLPTGGEVTHGEVITDIEGGNLMLTQTGPRAIMDWQSFDIDLDRSVFISQPSDDAAMLARVVGGTPSSLLGKLQANGLFFLVNPAGVVFGEEAQVDVGSLIVSTLEISNEEFLTGKYGFKGAEVGSIQNSGSLHAEESIVLVANEIRNAGIVEAAGAGIGLVSASRVHIEEIAGGSVSIDVSGLLGELHNSGHLTADTVEVSADQINELGSINAASLDVRASGDILGADELSIEGSAVINAGSGDIHLEAVGGSSIDFGTFTLIGENAVVVEASSSVLTRANLGSLDLSSGGAITQTDALLISGEARFDANGQSVDLRHPSNDFGSLAVLADNLEILDTNEIDLGDIDVNSLSIRANRGIANSGDVAVKGNARFNSGTGPINIGNRTTANFGSISIDQTTTATIRESSGTTLDGIAAGQLVLESDGDVSDIGPLFAPQGVTIEAGNGAITLDNPFSSFGSFSGIGREVNLESALALSLGEVVAGSLVVDVGGDLTQTGALIVEGDATFASGGNIDLSIEDNRFEGTVEFSIPGDRHLSISDSTDLELHSLSLESLSVSAEGIRQNGALSVSGTASFYSGRMDTLITNEENSFGSLELAGRGAQVSVADDLLISGVNLSDDFYVESGGGILGDSSSEILVGGRLSLKANRSIGNLHAPLDIVVGDSVDLRYDGSGQDGRFWTVLSGEIMGGERSDRVRYLGDGESPPGALLFNERVVFLGDPESLRSVDRSLRELTSIFQNLEGDGISLFTLWPHVFTERVVDNSLRLPGLLITEPVDAEGLIVEEE